MIRKYARLDASLGTVRAIFRDVERWQAWRPRIQSLKMLEHTEHRDVVEIRQRLAGRTLTQTLELVFDDRGFTETQIAGRLKRWQTIWRFAEPPAGGGTVISTQIDLDFGILGFLIPKGVMQRTIDRLYEEIVGRAEARARRREALRMPTVWGVLPGQKLAIRVYETPTELEVWFGERRFVVPAAE